MRSLGVTRCIVLDDQNPFELPLGHDRRRRRQRGGITVAGHDSIAVDSRRRCSRARSKRSSRAAPRPSSSPRAVGPGPVTLWQELHKADPHLLLLGSSSMATKRSPRSSGAAAARPI